MEKNILTLYHINRNSSYDSFCLKNENYDIYENLLFLLTVKLKNFPDECSCIFMRHKLIAFNYKNNLLLVCYQKL